jgi:ferritin-like protein
VADHRTRRELLRHGRPSDPELLVELGRLELLAAFVYGRALASSHLRAAARPLVEQVLDQEQAHAQALLAELAGPRPRGPVDESAAERELGRLGLRVTLERVRREDRWLAVLEAIEGQLERAYHRAVAELASADLQSLSASIIANEAQHAALLRELRYPRSISLAVPDALVV